MNTNLPPDIKTTAKLLKLRSILDKIGQASWSFSVLNKQHPIQTISEAQAVDLMGAYRDIIENIKNSIETEYEPETRQTA